MNLLGKLFIYEYIVHLCACLCDFSLATSNFNEYRHRKGEAGSFRVVFYQLDKRKDRRNGS